MSLSSPIFNSIMNSYNQDSDFNPQTMAQDFMSKSRSSLAPFNEQVKESNTLDRTQPESSLISGKESLPKMPESNSSLISSIKGIGNPTYSKEKRGQKGFEDCSSAACKVMKNAYGKDVGNTTLAMRSKGRSVSDSVVGDLLHFDTGKDTRHVGIDIGGGDMWHMSTSGPRTQSISSYPFKAVDRRRY